MGGCRWLFISKDMRVFRIPQPMRRSYKPVPQLSNQDVLEVILYYETNNRKPNRLLIVNFDRLQLDSSGAYVVTDEDRKKELHNFFEFGLPEFLGEKIKDKPVALPVAPTIPTEKEKNALYDYLTNKLPALAKGAPLLIEGHIRWLNEKHKEYINIVRNSKKNAR